MSYLDLINYLRSQNIKTMKGSYFFIPDFQATLQIYEDSFFMITKRIADPKEFKNDLILKTNKHRLNDWCKNLDKYQITKI